MGVETRQETVAERAESEADEVPGAVVAVFGERGACDHSKGESADGGGEEAYSGVDRGLLENRLEVYR